MFHTEDYYTKIGKPVLGVLRAKHLEDRAPSTQSLEAYSGRPPDIFILDLTEDTVMEVAWSIYGSAGPRVTDSVSLQHWILLFEE